MADEELVKATKGHSLARTLDAAGWDYDIRGLQVRMEHIPVWLSEPLPHSETPLHVLSPKSGRWPQLLLCYFRVEGRATYKRRSRSEAVKRAVEK